MINRNKIKCKNAKKTMQENKRNGQPKGQNSEGTFPKGLIPKGQKKEGGEKNSSSTQAK